MSNTSSGTSLLVSIHDVTPAMAEEVRALWMLCRANGATPALFVVPDWHGAWAIERHPHFMDWVRARAREGAEIVLHGERHDEHCLSRAWRDELKAFGRTNNEGEFLTLDGDTARASMLRGLSRLRDQQLRAVGFVPPAWLAREETHDVVAELGLLFSEDTDGVRRARDRTRIKAPALRWSGRTTTRAVASRVVADARWRLWQRAPMLRLALHPQDLKHPITATSVSRDVARWLRVRKPIRYDQL